MEKLTQGNLKGIAELPELNKTGTEAQIQTDADDTDHGRDAPDKAVHSAVNTFDGLQHNTKSPHK